MTEWEKLQSGQIYNDFDDDLFKNVGKDVWIEPDFHCEFGKNIMIEDNVYINFGCVILDCAEVVIGANSLLGPNIGIYAVNHSIDADERIAGGCMSAPVHIGKNVWLGGDVKIMAGVTIGDNVVIGSGSIVTKDIPDNVIAVGNPCRVLRPITDTDKIGYLQSK